MDDENNEVINNEEESITDKLVYLDDKIFFDMADAIIANGGELGEEFFPYEFPKAIEELTGRSPKLNINIQPTEHQSIQFRLKPITKTTIIHPDNPISFEVKIFPEYGYESGILNKEEFTTPWEKIIELTATDATNSDYDSTYEHYEDIVSMETQLAEDTSLTDSERSTIQTSINNFKKQWQDAKAEAAWGVDNYEIQIDDLNTENTEHQYNNEENQESNSSGNENTLL